MGVRKRFPAYRPGAIYRNRYEKKTERYRFLMPTDYAEHCTIGDCWLCDGHGNPKPGYEYPVPVCAGNIGTLETIVEFG